MGTRRDGLFLYDGSQMRPFPTDVDPLIKANNLYRAFDLPNGSIALTTTAAGMVILDRQGRLPRAGGSGRRSASAPRSTT